MINRILSLLLTIIAIIGIGMISLPSNYQVIVAHFSGAATFLIICLMIYLMFQIKHLMDKKALILGITSSSLMLLMYFMYMFFNLEAIRFALSAYGFDLSTSLTYVFIGSLLILVEKLSQKGHELMAENQLLKEELRKHNLVK